MPCLTVVRRDGDKIKQLSTFYGEEAYQLYSKLIGAKRYLIK